MNRELQKLEAKDSHGSSERKLMMNAIARLNEIAPVTARSSGKAPTARLAFVLDLTGSRSASLDKARIATASMFDAIKAFGTIAVKLIYFRGDECKSGRWENDAAIVRAAMQRLTCETGFTQIGRALGAILNEKEPLSGVVLIGDHCEEWPASLADIAAALKAKRIPVFVFHECDDDDRRAFRARSAFKGIAQNSGGVYCEFKPDSADALRELLASVAAFGAAGVAGMKNVAQPRTVEARQLQRFLLAGAPKDH